MGDYTKPTMMKSLLASNHKRHPTEIADLQGARLVTAVELNVGRRWDEGKIKLLTGGDKLKAFFMKQDFFEFDPTFEFSDMLFEITSRACAIWQSGDASAPGTSCSLMS